MEQQSRYKQDQTVDSTVQLQRLFSGIGANMSISHLGFESAGGGGLEHNKVYNFYAFRRLF